MTGSATPSGESQAAASTAVPVNNTNYPPVQPQGPLASNMPDQRQDPAIYPDKKDGAYVDPNAYRPGYPPAGPPGYPVPGLPYPYSTQQYPQYPYYPGQPQRPPHHHVDIVQVQPVTTHDAQRERQGVMFGTFTLILGLCFPIAWFVGGFIPFCYPRTRRVRNIAIANSVAFIVAVILAIVIPVLVTRRNDNNGYYGPRPVPRPVAT